MDRESGGEHGDGAGSAGRREGQRVAAVAVVVAADQVERQALLGPPELQQLVFPPLGHGRHHLPLPPPAAAAALVAVGMIRPVPGGSLRVRGAQAVLLVVVLRGRPVPLQRVAAQEHTPGAVVLVAEAPRRLHRLALLHGYPPVHLSCRRRSPMVAMGDCSLLVVCCADVGCWGMMGDDGSLMGVQIKLWRNTYQQTIPITL